MQNLTDSELIAQAKKDPQAFGMLYERYVRPIYRYHYSRSGNAQDAEDLTARTFYRALQALPRYQDRGLPFAAWLYRIAHNVVANWLRDRSRKAIVALDNVAVVVAPDKEPHLSVEEQEKLEQLLQLVRCLPQERQELLTLKFVAEMSNAEIGLVMGRSEGAIKSLYHRTLLALREQLTGKEE